MSLKSHYLILCFFGPNQVMNQINLQWTFILVLNIKMQHNAHSQFLQTRLDHLQHPDKGQKQSNAINCWWQKQNSSYLSLAFTKSREGWMYRFIESLHCHFYHFSKGFILHTALFTHHHLREKSNELDTNYINGKYRKKKV